MKTAESEQAVIITQLDKNVVWDSEAVDLDSKGHDIFVDLGGKEGNSVG